MNRYLPSLIAAILLTGIAAFPTAGHGKGRALTAEQQRAWKAARALYGEGLTVKRTRKHVTITAKPGGLSQETFNTYVEKYYLPALAKVSFSRGAGNQHRWATQYSDRKFSPGAATKLGYLLLEPIAKAALCRIIAYDIGPVPTVMHRYDRENWCYYQGIIHAFSSVYEYRGTKAVWDTAQRRGNLAITDPIYAKGRDGNYPIIVTVSSSPEVLSKAAETSARELYRKLESAAPDAKLHATADRYWKRMSKRRRQVVAKAKTKQRRLAKGKAIFAESPFLSWLAHPPAKAAIACTKSYFVAYAPKRKRSHGYHLSVNIDGRECSGLFMESAERDSNAIHQLSECAKRFKPGATHKLALNMHENIITGRFHRYDVDRRGIKRVNYDTSKRGRKLFGATITCRMPR